MTTRNNPARWAWVATATALTACSTTPPPQLDSARQAYEAAAEDPDVNKYASVQLYDAKKQLDRAAAFWEDAGDADETAHLAELSEKRVEIAQTVATGAKAQQETRELLESRGQIELATRDQALLARERELAARDEEIAALKAKPTDSGMVLTLGGDVLFQTGSATMSSGAGAQLNRVAQFLKENPEREVVVSGFTDSTGSLQLNQTLSEQRASAVANYLIGQGVAASRLATRGLGPSLPIAPNDTPAGRQQNRRVEITVLNPGEKAAEHVLARP
jgi:outer membrane protein OmpA-like peptidoglycan-associated protein